MTWFLCISPASKHLDLKAAFEPFELIDAASIPIGAATRAGRENRSAYLVTLNGDSTDVLGLGYSRAGRFPEFIDCLERLGQAGPAVFVLAHSFRGDLRTECVEVTRKETLSGEHLADLDGFEEDVRYVVLP